MSVLTLFQTNSPYVNDINKNNKLTPNELDNNFLGLKGDDIEKIEFDNEINELVITLNNGKIFNTIIPLQNAIIDSNGETIIDFKSINNDIVLVTDDKTYSVNIEDFPIIQELSTFSEIVDGNYNPETGVLTLVKDDGTEIKCNGFINYLNDGIVSDAFLDNKCLTIKMKNGKEILVDLSPLISTMNVDTFNFKNKVVRINKLKSEKTPLIINEHLKITDNMTYEEKQMTVGDNEVTGANSLAVGKDNKITSSYSVAFGTGNENHADNTITMGITNKIEAVAGQNSAEGAGAFGKDHINNAKQSFMFGLKGKHNPGASYSLSAGTEIEINSPSSLAAGIRTKTNADASFAQGIGSIAGGKASQAFGTGTKTLGENAHAEGNLSEAKYKDSHAEGYYTIADGHTAHSEGYETKALETASHAEGQYTETRALASHVGGSNNLIDEHGKYSFVHGSGNRLDAELSFIFGENNTATKSCLKNVYVLGRNITATTRDTLYLNKLNINDLENVKNFKKYFLQQDSNGTVFKMETTDVLEMLSGNFAIITNGEYINYGDNCDDNKIVLKGDIDEYEVVIDHIKDTHLTSGMYDPYVKHLYLTNNCGETIDIDFNGGEVPILSVAVTTNNTIDGDGTITKPLRIAPNEQTGQYKPAIAIVDTLPTTNLIPGDRYVTKQEIITGGYLYDFDDIKDTDFGNGWRLPTRKEWDDLLNSLETNPDAKNHGEVGPSGWRGEIAANSLKAQSFGGNDIFNFNILPCHYINSDGSVAPNNNARFWCATQVHSEWDVFSKRFKIDEGRVYSEAVPESDTKLSVRLINDSLTASNTINGVEYNVVAMPGQKLWLANNLSDETIPYVIPDNNQSSSFKTVNVVAEWDGEKWVTKELKEGYSIVIINTDDPDIKDVEYRIINGVLTIVDTDSVDIELLKQALQQEIADRIAGDATLQTEIDNEVTRAEAAEAALQTEIDTVSDNLTQETVDRIAGDTALQTNIDNEKDEREAADHLLDVKIETETDERKIADQDLQTQITTEKTEREDADQELRDSISLVSDALTDEIDARIAADNNLQTQITTEKTEREEADTALQTAIDNEITRAEAAEAALQTAIDNEVTRATTKEDDLQEQIDELTGGASDLLDKINQEIADRIAGDTALQQEITDETTNRENADTALQNQITQEVTDRTNADTVLQTNIDNEVTRATTEEATLQTNIDNVNTDLQKKNVVGVDFDFQNGVLTLVKGDTAQNITITFTNDYGTF